MGLAKYMEDNLERLYSSLEDTRQQVSSINKDSVDKDWEFIKNRLEKELALVIQQYDEVLKIVTNPQFDDFTELYEENLALDKKLQTAHKQNDHLNKCLAHTNCTVSFMHKDMSNIQLSLRNTEKSLTRAQRNLDKSEQIIKDLKSEMSPIKDKLNTQVQNCNNLRTRNEHLASEIEIKSNQIATLELLIDSPEYSTEILSIKDDEVNHLKNDLYTLHDWCELLEAELGVTRPSSTALPTKSTSINSKNRNHKSKSLSSFLALSHENERLKAELVWVKQTVLNQENCIAEKEEHIRKFKNEAVDSVIKVNDLRDINSTLRKKIESLQMDTLGYKKEVKKTTSNKKITTKKYEPPKRTTPPPRRRHTPINRKDSSYKTTRTLVDNDNLGQKDSYQQFSDYLNKYKKK